MIEFSGVYKAFLKLGPDLIPTCRNLIYVEFLEIKKEVCKLSNTAGLTNEYTAANITNTALIYESAAVKLLCVMIFVGGWKAGRMERQWH